MIPQPWPAGSSVAGPVRQVEDVLKVARSRGLGSNLPLGSVPLGMLKLGIQPWQLWEYHGSLHVKRILMGRIAMAKFHTSSGPK